MEEEEEELEKHDVQFNHFSKKGTYFHLDQNVEDHLQKEEENHLQKNEEGHFYLHKAFLIRRKENSIELILIIN